MAYIMGTDRQQISIFPETLDDYVGEDNICRVIDAFVESLNLLVLGFKYASLSHTGRPPYNPAVLLKLFIYGMLNRIRSSRRLHAECLRNIEVMWLLGKLVPDDKTICNFRKDNTKAIKRVFKEFNKFCLTSGLFGCETAAIDGSKFRANNSRRNIFTRDNVNKDIDEVQRQLNAKVTQYLEELEKNDTAENLDCQNIDSSKVEDALKVLNTANKEPNVRNEQPDPKKESLESEQENVTKQTLENDIRALNEKKKEFLHIISEMDKSGENQFSKNDPDSRLMVPGGDGREFDARYNVQFAVDSKNSLIADFEVTNDCNDKGQLKNMADKAKDVMEVDTLNALGDKGYYDGDDIEACEKDGITCYVAKPAAAGKAPEQLRLDKFKYDKELDAYICPMKQILELSHYQKLHGECLPVYACKSCRQCPVKNLCTKNPVGKEIIRKPAQDTMDIVDRRTGENTELYKKRGQIVEHPFGTIKSVWGFRNFLCKGFEMVSAEMALTCLAYNFRRVFNIFTKEKKGFSFSN